jgi:hypothetical protein
MSSERALSVFAYQRIKQQSRIAGRAPIPKGERVFSLQVGAVIVRRIVIVKGGESLIEKIYFSIEDFIGISLFH